MISDLQQCSSCETRVRWAVQWVSSICPERVFGQLFLTYVPSISLIVPLHEYDGEKSCNWVTVRHNLFVPFKHSQLEQMHCITAKLFTVWQNVYRHVGNLQVVIFDSCLACNGIKDQFTSCFFFSSETFLYLNFYFS